MGLPGRLLLTAIPVSITVVGAVGLYCGVLALFGTLYLGPVVGRWVLSAGLVGAAVVGGSVAWFVLVHMRQMRAIRDKVLAEYPDEDLEKLREAGLAPRRRR